MSETAIRVQHHVEAETAVRRGPGVLRSMALLARVTFREAARRKILWIASMAAVLFLVLFWTGLHAMLKSSTNASLSVVNQRESISMMLMMALYAASMLTSMMAALTSCDTLSGEISSGTIHAIATKPVRRWCLVLGKWMGFAGMLTLYILLIDGGCIALGCFEGGYFIPHIVAVLCLLWLQAVLLLGVTMACSTTFSALTSGAFTLGLYGLAFVGGWIEQFGALRHVKTCVNLGILSSLLMPSDALWRRTAFKLQPPMLGAVGASPFASRLVPSAAMVVYAVAYAGLALLLAAILFERRDL
jgi:ABC-type transport system involved in multi-copper enzyme maturation permease subunit